MDSVKNALMAPFSDSAAAASTPAKTAIAYGLIGLIAGAFFLK